MNPGEVFNLAMTSIWTIIKVSGPIMVIGMVVGLVIAIFQAMTQIQEMTLAFVPKILAIFVGLLVFISFMGNAIYDLGMELFDKMIHLG